MPTLNRPLILAGIGWFASEVAASMLWRYLDLTSPVWAVLLFAGLIILWIAFYWFTKPDKLLGKPDYIDGEGVRHYSERSHLPTFDDIFAESKSIHILGQNLLNTLRANPEPIEKVVRKEKDINLYLLKPNSVFFRKQIDPTVTNINNDMRAGFENLTKLRNKLGSPPNLHLWQYDADCFHSFVIIDPENNERAWIQIEDYPLGSYTAKRPNHIGTRKRTPDFWKKYYSEFATVTSAKEAI